jgi:hypothetical protein
MLAGAGLSRLWPHDRAHWFFSRARWSPDELGLAVARQVVRQRIAASIRTATVPHAGRLALRSRPSQMAEPSFMPVERLRHGWKPIGGSQT